MDLPFTKPVVDSRHAASGDASNFDITLPESLTLPPNTVCYTTGIAIAHLFPSMGSGPSLRNTFYWVERIGDACSSSDYLNRAMFDEAKTYTAIGLAAEIQRKVNAASVLGGGYAVTYQEDSGTMLISRAQESNTVNSFWLVDDDLLRDANFQQLFGTATTPSLTPYTLNYNTPQSCMQLLGLGRRGSTNTSYTTLYLATLQACFAYVGKHGRRRRAPNSFAVSAQPHADQLQVPRPGGISQHPGSGPRDVRLREHPAPAAFRAHPGLHAVRRGDASDDSFRAAQR